ncbi:MAG: dihydroneopterin aldolase [Gaiellales bacterium]|nr:MAG: dihydroneopterin aldolase [Gaiellales bacterium]
MMPGQGQAAVLRIEGLEVTARHGLLPQEKESDQLFRFDLELRMGSCPACVSDKIEDTVDYAAVIDDVVAAATTRQYELLERLATVVAGAVLERHVTVDSVLVRVEKAAPPVDQAVGSVSVIVEVER